jgi:hypothetical protein
MSETPFFIAGDMLPANTPSYVTRPADHDLSASVLEGAFCYVLTARQMGKSSLMVRTASHLREQRIRVAQVDLRTITSISTDEWYVDLLVRIQQGLDLKSDARAWWRTQAGLGAPQRFIDFLRDVALKEIAGNVVLFIDEIDAMLTLDFRDNFFAAIRAMYNARASDSAYKRLTFVLLGVATPTDLIRDPKLTPFNIGRSIELQEFSYADAAPLRRGLEQRYANQADTILRRIFYWTNGHPYLTQKLCSAVARARGVTTWDDGQVDKLVAANFFGKEASRDPNLTFVRDKVLNAPEGQRQQMLALYSAVYAGQPVGDDESSPAQNHLELYGLVRVEKGKLQVRNEIYRHVFNDKWPRPNTLTRLNRFTISAIVLIVALLLSALFIATTPSVTFANAGPSSSSQPIPIQSGEKRPISVQPQGIATQVLWSATCIINKNCSVLQNTIGLDNVLTAPHTINEQITVQVIVKDRFGREANNFLFFTVPPPIPVPTPLTPTPTAAAPTSTPTAATPTSTPMAATPTQTPTSTPMAATPTQTPTSTPMAATPTQTPTSTPTLTVPPEASCTVISGANVHVQPNDNTNIGTLAAGETFIPEARSADTDTFVWVKVQATQTRRGGWVYAGNQPKLVECTGLDNVPIQTQ